MKKQETLPEITALSGMRGFAALWVFIYHFWALQIATPVVISFFGVYVDISWCFTFGWLGVPIFFVLSGFLLAQPFVRQFDARASSKVSIRAYLIRRCMRVCPAYYFQLAVLVMLAYFFQFGEYPRGAASWLAHLTMTFFSPPYFIAGINGAWWTLPIEFGFYLLLPMLAVLLKPQRWLLLVLFCFGTMLSYRYLIYSVYLGTDVPLYTRISLLPGVMDSFGLGMLSAYCVQHVRVKPIFESWAANAATFTMLLGYGIAMLLIYHFWMYYWSGGWMAYVYTPFFSAAIACGVFGAARGSSWAQRIFGNQVMCFFGNISYSLYLWHLPLLGALKLFPELQEIDAHRHAFSLAICTFILVAISWMSWRFVELPGIALGKRLSRFQSNAKAQCH